MPRTMQEQAAREALDTIARGFDVPTPLNDDQARWLGELLLGLGPVPRYMHGGLVRYLLAGVRPGRFLTALLENDLAAAVVHADDENYPLLRTYVHLLHARTLGNASGSREVVAAWVARRGLLGPEERAVSAATVAGDPLHPLRAERRA